jgi:hypothetical protein
MSAGRLLAFLAFTGLGVLGWAYFTLVPTVTKRSQGRVR